jgi:gluconate 2-dehydrogenase gamma chain
MWKNMLRREWMQMWMLAAPAAAQHAHEQMSLPAAARKLRYFSAAEAEKVAALASVIIPSDEGPGAREAGVVYFIDALLMGAGPKARAVYKAGLLSSEAAKEGEPFFEMVRTHTVMGFLSDPKYGGNAGEAGWKVIGFENRMGFTTPFGFYDGEGSK